MDFSLLNLQIPAGPHRGAALVGLEIVEATHRFFERLHAPENDSALVTLAFTEEEGILSLEVKGGFESDREADALADDYRAELSELLPLEDAKISLEILHGAFDGKATGRAWTFTTSLRETLAVSLERVMGPGWVDRYAAAGGQLTDAEHGFLARRFPHSRLIVGVFDYLRCGYPLPLPELQDAVFQTCDLLNYMESYTLREDGTLWHTAYDVEDRSDPNARGIMRLAGCATRVNQREEFCDTLTDTVTFQGSYGPSGDQGEATFEARFIRGRLESLALREHLPRPSTKARERQAALEEALVPVAGQNAPRARI